MTWLRNSVCRRLADIIYLSFPLSDCLCVCVFTGPPCLFLILILGFVHSQLHDTENYIESSVTNGAVKDVTACKRYFHNRKVVNKYIVFKIVL